MAQAFDIRGSLAQASAGSEGGFGMRVKKRDGSLESVDVNKIVRAVARCAQGLDRVDPIRVAQRTIGGLYGGATTQALDQLSIQTAAGLIVEQPILAARRAAPQHLHRQRGLARRRALILAVDRARSSARHRQ